MSTEPRPTRRTRSRRRRGRAFAGAFAIVVGVLAVVGVTAAAASVVQGPRVTATNVDPAAAVAASGSRVNITLSQSLEEVDPSQVTITPETPFAVDTSGRSVGVRFALPLWDETDYTVRIDGLRGLGGGPAATATVDFTTPALTEYLLQRGDDEDTVFRTGIDGEAAVPVFTHAHIEDFRATGSHLVFSVRTENDEAALIVTDRDGADARELALPGEGFVSNLQSADRGEIIGYTFSDADLEADGARESVLYTASLQESAAGDDPNPVEIEGSDPRVADWRFVPDTDSVLLLSFDGTLLLAGAHGEDAAALGSALGIDGIARGSSLAVVERLDGLGVVDLTTGTEEPLVEPEGATGPATSVTPLPDGSTIRTSAVLEDDGSPTGRTAVDLVAADGGVVSLTEVADTDAVLQTCVSPSARYAAVLVAPDAIGNPYDTYYLPLPETVETRIIAVDDAEQLVALAGSSISWCQTPPR